MSQLYCTGPVNVFVGGGPLGNITFLGWCEHAPNVQVRPSYDAVYVDLGGQKIPFDMVYNGSDGLVTGDMTKINWPVLDAIRAFPNPAPAATPGVDMSGAIGTLMITEGATYSLY